MKRVLLIAYHYPPVFGSSGVQRTLAFSRFLPAEGWQPIVLTVSPRAYPSVDYNQAVDALSGIEVRRAFALDTARHLALAGRYPSVLALPDRWITWLIPAVFAGLRLIRRHKIDALWSTYPIATAHVIGWALKRLSGLPWVADFRDLMMDVDYPTDPTVRRVFGWVERNTVHNAARCVVTTPGARQQLAGRYEELADLECDVIANGYDEEEFAKTQGMAPSSRCTPAQCESSRPVTLLHSGILYPSERDPRALFRAIARLRTEGSLSARDLRVVLRATGHDDYLQGLIDEAGIGDMVSLATPLPYREALAEMLSVDALLILQASNCNQQIPAKLYEYFRARRPVLALTDPEGDTAAALHDAGVSSIVRLDAEQDIAAALPEFVAQVRSGAAPVASEASIMASTRQARTAELSRLLDEVITQPIPHASS